MDYNEELDKLKKANHQTMQQEILSMKSDILSLKEIAQSIQENQRGIWEQLNMIRSCYQSQTSTIEDKISQLVHAVKHISQQTNITIPPFPSNSMASQQQLSQNTNQQQNNQSINQGASMILSSQGKQ